jgi:hypothetical protein
VNLERLHLAENLLTCLPSSFGNLHSLNALQVRWPWHLART